MHNFHALHRLVEKLDGLSSLNVELVAEDEWDGHYVRRNLRLSITNVEIQLTITIWRECRLPLGHLSEWQAWYITPLVLRHAPQQLHYFGLCCTAGKQNKIATGTSVGGHVQVANAMGLASSDVVQVVWEQSLER
jgi:hypothetical protein